MKKRKVSSSVRLNIILKDSTNRYVKPIEIWKKFGTVQFGKHILSKPQVYKCHKLFNPECTARGFWSL